MMLKGILRLKVAPNLSCWCRGYAVDKQSLSKLRKRTGISFSSCKKALEKFNNDIPQAEKWLQEQAQKEGWTKATKVGSRPMSTGLIGLVSENKSATILEINCETDFVAKNAKFQELVAEVTGSCHKQFLSGAKHLAELTKEDLNGLLIGERTVADAVALTVGNIGENMSVRRAKFFSVSEDSYLGTYVHAAGKSAEINNCMLGKFGAIVELERQGTPTLETDELSPIETIATQIAQHVVGMNPSSVGEFTEQTADIEEVQSEENTDKEVEREKSEAGEDLMSDDVSADDKKEFHKEETTLLNQSFVLDQETKVGEVMLENGLCVKNFVRFECGEELEGIVEEEVPEKLSA